jgi:hypothetical protein
VWVLQKVEDTKAFVEESRDKLGYEKTSSVSYTRNTVNLKTKPQLNPTEGEFGGQTSRAQKNYFINNKITRLEENVKS